MNTTSPVTPLVNEWKGRFLAREFRPPLSFQERSTVKVIDIFWRGSLNIWIIRRLKSEAAISDDTMTVRAHVNILLRKTMS